MQAPERDRGGKWDVRRVHGEGEGQGENEGMHYCLTIVKQVVECEEREVPISVEDYIRLYVARHISWHTVTFWE